MVDVSSRFKCLDVHIHYSVLDVVCRNIEENNHEITDDHIATLFSVFGRKLEKSFEMIDKECFELVKIADTDRTYIVVNGSTGIYTLYRDVNFCQCLAYKVHASKRKNVICKHIIGSRLALALKKYKERTSIDFIYHNMSDSDVLGN